jgi:hypothetical protein
MISEVISEDLADSSEEKKGESKAFGEKPRKTRRFRSDRRFGVTVAERCTWNSAKRAFRNEKAHASSGDPIALSGAAVASAAGGGRLTGIPG